MTMNKKMRDIIAEMRSLQDQAEKYRRAGDTGNMNTILDEIENLQSAYSTEKAIFALERENVPDNAPEGENKATGFNVIAKMISRQTLTDAENALLTVGENGEGYLIPEDVDLQIREARKSYTALKEYVTVYPTSMLSGTAVYDSDDDEDLDSFEDGNEITAATDPKFTQKKWQIGFYGKTIPISNILQGAEQAGLMAYINRWFIRKAVRTENKAIITALKKGKSAVKIKGMAGLKEQINTKIDDDYLTDAVILTNHTGFHMLDSEVDAVGRPMLNRDPLNPATMLFMGLPVIKVSDSLLPNVSSEAPIFIGSLKAGIAFHDYMSLQFAVSEHVYFNKNQTAMRVIEGFSVEQEFPDAYIYGLLSADGGKVVTTKTASAS